MSRMISVRLDEQLVADVDRERRREGISRARAIHDALKMWVTHRRFEQAAECDRQGYDRQPVTEDEFGPVLGAQQWPK